MDKRKGFQADQRATAFHHLGPVWGRDMRCLIILHSLPEILTHKGTAINISQLESLSLTHTFEMSVVFVDHKIISTR